MNNRELHAHLAHAITVLELQQQLIDALSTELAVTRADRDEARQIRGLLQALTERRVEAERRVCRCGAAFTPTANHTRVCPACRSAHAKIAGAASRAAAAERRAGQET
jgi:phosphate uptake regulator